MANQPIISLIAAVAEDFTIGDDGDLPWRLPNDLKWFKSKTVNKPVLMGRVTHESLGFALPSRRNIILTRDPSYRADGCEVANTIEEALDLVGDSYPELMILGGAAVYKQFMDRADRFYLTIVHEDFSGDTRFPAFDADQWRVTFTQKHEKDAKNPHAHTFYILERTTYAPATSQADRVDPLFLEPPAS